MAYDGDTLIATPLIRELRANFPEAVIDALAMWPGSKDLLENNPHINRSRKTDSACGKLEAIGFLRLRCGRERYQLSINTCIRRSHQIDIYRRMARGRLRCASAMSTNASTGWTAS